jgi:hypothetical protein
MEERCEARVPTKRTVVQSMSGTITPGSRKEMLECRAFVGQANEKIVFTVQAYADDVIFISKEPKGIRKVLQVLEQFVDWSQMKVNV